MRLRAELIPTIPAPARVVARNVVWAYGRATSGARPLPDFLIIGAQKAGTTALYAYLREHPDAQGDELREALAGNLCRCTGYLGIIEAVEHAAVELRRGTDGRD